MRILVISDTHSLELPEKVRKEFSQVDLVIHAGDICSLEYFNDLPKGVEIKAVTGNMDDPEMSEKLEKKLFFDLEEVKVGLFHGRGPSRRVKDFVVEEFALDKEDVIIFGHSHTPFNEVCEGVLYFNPGSATDNIFAPYRSYGILEIEGAKVKGKIVKLDYVIGMVMDTLWAPWRVKYITRGKDTDKKCVFCEIFKEKKDKKNFILIRKEHCFAVLNIYPYNNGHILIVPNRHVKDINKLKVDEKMEIFSLIEEITNLYDEVMKPQGYNVGINLGRVAGAGVPGHLHVHIVPRWRGDSNFMPVIGKTKVMSQSLNALYKLLKDAYKKRH